MLAFVGQVMGSGTRTIPGKDGRAARPLHTVDLYVEGPGMVEVTTWDAAQAPEGTPAKGSIGVYVCSRTNTFRGRVSASEGSWMSLEQYVQALSQQARGRAATA